MRMTDLLGAAREIAGLASKPGNQEQIFDKVVRLADHVERLAPANASFRQQRAWTSPAVANGAILNWGSQCATEGNQLGAGIAEVFIQVINYFVLVQPISTVPSGTDPTDPHPNDLDTIGNAANPAAAMQAFTSMFFAWADDVQQLKQTYTQRKIIAAAILPVMQRIFGSLISNWSMFSQGMQGQNPLQQVFQPQGGAMQGYFNQLSQQAPSTAPPNVGLVYTGPQYNYAPSYQGPGHFTR